MPNTQSSLTALSPLDGRYHSQLTALANLFSEFGFIHFRVMVEVSYLLFLADEGLIPQLTEKQRTQLQAVAEQFSIEDAEQVKTLERKTKHDVKAIEYFVRERLHASKIPIEQYVHIALTSEDVNALAYSLMIQSAQKVVLVPQLKNVLRQLSLMAKTTADIPLLAKTHGQPAVPTTVGKELAVFGMRFLHELQQLEKLIVESKLTGAVGNFNAHSVAFPHKKWVELSAKFVASFGLQPNVFTTQVLPAESYSQFFGSLQRINTVLLDCTQDIWRYISDGVFLQKVEVGQVGSSTMPQKINPIDFENSEGNFGLANSLLSFFIQKLPVSRLQRDLSDSTVKRSIGSALGYSLLGYSSLHKGLAKLSVNQEKLEQELEDHWEVLAEAFQVVLRTSGDEQGYEKLKTFSQGKKLTRADFQRFIETLQINPEQKQALAALAPSTYLGFAPELTQLAIQEINDYLQGDA